MNERVECQSCGISFVDKATLERVHICMITNPRCKKCSCLYPVEYSRHQDYCDDCVVEVQA